MKNNNIDKNLKLFAMQNLLLENDLARLEESGIELEHIRSIRKDDLVDVELFDGDILKDAKRMADFYVLFYSLENTIRRLIKERLYDAHGANWWEIAIPV